MKSLYSVLFLCFTLLPVVYGVGGDPLLSAVQVQLGRSPNAQCSDGTPAAYYWKQGGVANGVDGTNTWLIALDDGFPMETSTIPSPQIPACIDPTTCVFRQNNSPNDVTTVTPGTTRRVGGIFSTNPANNPQFANSNLALIHYCSNDLWLGSNGSITLNDGTTFVFRGMPIVDAVIDDLINRFPAIATTQAEILFLGPGFGGVGLSALLDHVCLRFPRAVRCGGVLDGAVYVQPDFVNIGIADFVRVAWPIWQPRLTDTGCVTKNPSFATQPHTCAIVQTSLLFHNTPLFMFQSLSDFTAMQLTGFTYDTSTDVIMQQLANLIYQQICSLSTNPKIGYYAPSCSVHSYLFSTPIFTTSFFPGFPLPSAALSSFFRTQQQMSLANPPYACNAVCMSITGTFPITPRCDVNAKGTCFNTMNINIPPKPTIPPIVPVFNNIVAIGHAIIRPVTTAGVGGSVFIEQDGTTGLSRITLQISNLNPQPDGYGVYITNFGDTSNVPLSVGDHFNPTNMQHGCVPGTLRHVGDLGTILNSTSMGTTTPPGQIILFSELLTMTTNQSIIGRSIVISATPCNGNGIVINGGQILAAGIIGIGNPGTGINIASQQLITNSNVMAFTPIFNNKGQQVGTIRFSQPLGGKVRITGNVTGLTPLIQHGMHIHTFGEVTNKIIIGSHFNPRRQPHALPPVANRELGDLGNIVTNAAGVAIIDTDVGTELISLSLPASGVIGRTIAFDPLPDTGALLNAGASAWGVIGLSSITAAVVVPPTTPPTTVPTNPATTLPTTSTTTTAPTTTAPTTATSTTGTKHVLFLGSASHGYSLSWVLCLSMGIAWCYQWIEFAYFFV